MAAIAAEAPAGRAEIVRLEAATLSAWPALKSAWDGMWLWRFARGLSKRCNSIQVLDPTDDSDAARRLAAMAELSEVHRIPPIFRVTPLCGAGITGVLDNDGWTRFDETLVETLPLAEPVAEPSARVRQFNIGDRDWYGAQSEMAGYTPPVVAIFRDMVLAVPHEARGLLAYGADGVPAAAGMVVNAAGIAVFLNIVVSAEQRGRGLGRAVMLAGLDWARQDGAGTAALQVAADNAVARKLYGSLGFAERYRYHYRRAPQ